jgi:predicted RNA methylase
MQPFVACADYLRAKLFDWLHGVQTCGTIPLHLLSIESSNLPYRLAYSASTLKATSSILSELDIDYTKYVFIDFGSGKGRVLLLACEYPFKKVIGVEFARELHEMAVRNIRSYRSATQKCHDVQSVLCDATEYEIPPEPAIF